MNRKYGIFAILLLLAAFLACSDESVSEKTEYEVTDRIISVESIDDLPDCDEKTEGSLYWVSSEKLVRVCKDEKWFAVKPSEVVDSTIINMKDGGSDINLDSLANLDSLMLVDLIGEGLLIDSEQVVISVEDVSGFSQKGPFLLGSEVVAYELQNGRTLKQTGKQFHGKISDNKGSFNIRTIKVASQYAFLAAKGFYRNEVSGEVSGQQITLNALTDLRNRNIVNINVLTHLEYDRIIELVTKEQYTVREAKKKAEEEIFKIFHMDSLKIEGVSEDFSIGGSGTGDAALLAISVLLQRELSEAEMQSLITSMSEAIAKEGSLKNDSFQMAMADWVSNVELTDGYKPIRENVKNWKLSVNEVPDFETLLHHFWIDAYGMGECSKSRVGEVFAVDSKYSKNYKKKSTVRFTCAASSGKKVSYAWRYATSIEKDTYKWKAGTSDGIVQKGDVTDTMYVYSAKNKKWSYAGAIDNMFGGCQEKYFGQIKRLAGYNIFYRCDKSSQSWVQIYDYAEIDTQGWKAGKDGETRWGDTLGVSVAGPSACHEGYGEDEEVEFFYMTRLNGSLYSAGGMGFYENSCSCQMQKCEVNGCEDGENGYRLVFTGDDEIADFTFCNSGERACYYYDASQKKWLHVSSDHCVNNHNVGMCSKEHAGEIKYSESENRFFECVYKRDDWTWGYEIKWAEVTDAVRANTVNDSCDKDKWVTGFFAKDVHFVCDNGEWRAATVNEEYVGEPCFAQNEGGEVTVDDVVFTCSSSEWSNL